MKPSASATSKQPPYEDLISAFGPIRKPGYISPRSKEEQRRKAFVSDLISALQDASDARAARDEKTCARDAYSQLQYDFPVSGRGAVVLCSCSCVTCAYRSNMCSSALFIHFIHTHTPQCLIHTYTPHRMLMLLTWQH